MKVTISELRRKQRLQQKALAEKAGLHFVTLSRIERGLQVPNSTTLAKIAAALSVPVDSIELVRS